MTKENISSAEMTAHWRCQYPAISGDSLSTKLASHDGVQKALEFEEKYQYPLIGRKISVRAGWCLEQTTQMLIRGNYDSCISLGSGFSLLTYYAALATHQKKKIHFFDADLTGMIRVRRERIKQLPKNTLNSAVSEKIETVEIDLEKAFRQGEKFSDLFPSDCQAPVFVIEGLIYFLSENCVRWIFAGIAEYKNAGVVFDYWPEGSEKSSECFKRVLSTLKDFIPEKVQGLLNEAQLKKLVGTHLTQDVNLKDIEHNYAKQNQESAQLIDQNDFIPVQLATAEWG